MKVKELITRLQIIENIDPDLDVFIYHDQAEEHGDVISLRLEERNDEDTQKYDKTWHPFSVDKGQFTNKIVSIFGSITYG